MNLRAKTSLVLSQFSPSIKSRAT